MRKILGGAKKAATSASSKLLDGPGGWRCPCCNPYERSPRRMKALARRRIRRCSKAILRKDLRDAD